MGLSSTRNPFPCVLSADHDFFATLQDRNGDTALTLVRTILDQGRFAAALALTQLLVAAGADVNHRSVR
jgi:hypothetical protein